MYRIRMEGTSKRNAERRWAPIPGLWLREPGQFLHDAMPRVEAYLDRFTFASLDDRKAPI